MTSKFKTQIKSKKVSSLEEDLGSSLGFRFRSRTSSLLRCPSTMLWDRQCTGKRLIRTLLIGVLVTGNSVVSGHPTDFLGSITQLSPGFSPYDDVPYLAYPRTTARHSNAFLPTKYNASELQPDLIQPRSDLVPELQHNRHPLARDTQASMFKQQQPVRLTKRQAVEQTMAPFPPSKCERAHRRRQGLR